MPHAAYDLIILGGGAAGFGAAIEADRRGLQTLMVNAGLPLGGTCVNVGCIPTKNLLAVAKALRDAGHPAHGSVGPARPSFDFAAAIAEKDALIEGLRVTNYRDVLGDLKTVRWLTGKGTLVSAHEVLVEGTTYRGEKVLIATGCSTAVPDITGLEAAGYFTHATALSLPRLPASLLVLGGGPQGLEFAQLFSRMGSRVTIVEKATRIATFFEPEISEALLGYLADEGIEILTDATVERISRSGDLLTADVTITKSTRRIETAEVLVTTGVRANIEALGLDKAGVAVDRHRVVTDDYLQTTVPHIYAAGDVTGPLCLESVAAKQGKLAVENAFAGTRRSIEYRAVPSAVFTDPEAASVGLTEEALMKEAGSCDCRTVSLERVPRALAVKNTKGLVKLVAESGSGRIRGVHVLAPAGAEIIHEGALAVKLGLTVDDLIDTVHVFPTYSEAIKLAAQAYRRDVSKMSCCVE